jgi:prolyl 4-hydroxylase
LFRFVGEGIQVLRYQTGQAYIEHTDYFPISPKPDWNWDPARNGSNRFATVFLYLSDVDLGGQTVFPKAHIPDGWTPRGLPALADDGAFKTPSERAVSY